MVEDLTTVYEECTTERIKEMYQSYGEALLESATFDGRLYALPDAEESWSFFCGCARTGWNGWDFPIL